jgi:hypothetical protein
LIGEGIRTERRRSQQALVDIAPRTAVKPGSRLVNIFKRDARENMPSGDQISPPPQKLKISVILF